MTGAPTITIEHVRAARLDGRGVNCAAGIRAWARRHGIDVRAFMRDGMPMEIAEGIDDAFVRRVVEIAKGVPGSA